MFSRLFGSRRAEAPVYSAPEGSRVYAVGDIHGRADLVDDLHRKIVADSKAAGCGRNVVVYLGDYVDRGDASREVLDLLIGSPLPGFESVYLLGNHEDFMLTFLDDASVGQLWIGNGGDATLYSYGVGLPQAADRESRFEIMRETLVEKMPESHKTFLAGLKLYHVEGDYAFVHAGIRPGVPLDAQVADDVLWIRNEFLSSRADFGKCVVHGHTITETVDARHNRIGIDTGAYFSGHLTCLVLDGPTRNFLQT